MRQSARIASLKRFPARCSLTREPRGLRFLLCLIFVIWDWILNQVMNSITTIKKKIKKINVKFPTNSIASKAMATKDQKKMNRYSCLTRTISWKGQEYTRDKTHHHYKRGDAIDLRRSEPVYARRALHPTWGGGRGPDSEHTTMTNISCVRAMGRHRSSSANVHYGHIRGKTSENSIPEAVFPRAIEKWKRKMSWCTGAVGNLRNHSRAIVDIRCRVTSSPRTVGREANAKQCDGWAMVSDLLVQGRSFCEEQEEPSWLRNILKQYKLFNIHEFQKHKIWVNSLKKPQL